MYSLGFLFVLLLNIFELIDSLPLYLKIPLFAIIFGIVGYIISKITDSSDYTTISRTIKNIMNIYSKERSLDTNHENTLDTIIKSQFIFSETKQAEVKNNFTLFRTSDVIEQHLNKYSENQKIKSDLRVLSISILMIILRKNYMKFEKKVIEEFDKLYDTKALNS